MSTRKNTSEPEKRDKFINNGSEVGMYSATDESVTVPVCRDKNTDHAKKQSDFRIRYRAI